MRLSAKQETVPGLYNKPAVKIENDGKALLGNYARYNVEFVSGDGAYLYDKDGSRYLDFLSGIAVTGFGHNNYTIKMAVEDQIGKLWHVSNLFESSGQEELAKKLVSRTGLGKVFFCNSGTEANEAAIKFARRWGQGRSEIITALGGFHGRTMGSLSATAQYKVWEGFFPLTPGFKYVPFGDLEAIEHSITSSTVAVMVEPIQGESGIIVPPKGYLEGLREICNKHNLLLILDEVQTGMGRTGKLFAYQWADIKPDIITSAKGIANGIPLGAVICSEDVGLVMIPGSHGSTFGGNPIAIAAANKVTDLLDEYTLNQIESYGNMLKNAVLGLNLECIKEVRGKGLLVGIELQEGKSAKAAAKKMLENKVVTGVSGDNVLRILPPFIITEKEILNFVLTLEKVLTSE